MSNSTYLINVKGDFKSVFITQENTEDKSDEHAEPSGDTKQKTNKVTNQKYMHIFLLYQIKVLNVHIDPDVCV